MNAEMKMNLLNTFIYTRPSEIKFGNQLMYANLCDFIFNQILYFTHFSVA